MKRGYADIPEGQMHYRFSGSGDSVIVLLHMSGSSSEEFETLGDALAVRGHRVLAPDLLGFGSSDHPSHYYYSMDEHIASLLAFLDGLGVEKACFYGNMATANMSARLAAKHPERVTGLMLMHPLYNPDPEFYRRRGRSVGFCKIDVAADGSHLQEMWKRSHKYGDPVAVSDRRCADMVKAGEWSETLHWALHDDTPFGQYVPQLSVKTVIAAYGFFGEPVLLRELATHLPNGAFELVENATPYITRREPVRIAELVCRHFPA